MPGVGKGFGGVGKSAQGAVGGVRAFGASLAAALGPIIGVTTALAGFQKAVSTAFERDAAENRLKNLAETTGDYEYALAAAREASEKFGFTLTESTKLFGDAQARIGTLGYNVEQVNEIFTGFNVVARQAGVSSEDAAGAFTQLAQGMAAGTLQGDELRSILERMPAVTKLLADEMGVPVEQIKKLGSEGKITSDIIYNALSTAAEGAGDLDGKLTPLQKSFMGLKQNIEEAFNTIGQIIKPVLVPAIDFFSAAVQKLSDIWKYVAEKIFPDVAQAFEPLMRSFRELFKDFDWNALGALITNAIVVPLKVAAGGIKSMVPLFTFVVDMMKKIASNPVVQALTNAVGGLLQQLGLLSDPMEDFAKETEKGKKTTDELAGGVSAAKENTQAAAEAATRLAEAQKSAAAEAIKGAEAAEALRQNNLKLLSAEFGLQQTLLDIEAQKAQRALENAKTNEQVVAAANKIFKIAVEQAKLDRDIAKLKNKSAVEELAQKVRIIQATKAQAEAERAVLVAKGEAD